MLEEGLCYPLHIEKKNYKQVNKRKNERKINSGIHLTHYCREKKINDENSTKEGKWKKEKKEKTRKKKKRKKRERERENVNMA